MCAKRLNPDDYIGKRFGKLIVVSFAEMRNGRHSFWNCVCDCGNTTVTAGYRLKNGTCRSCGCISKEEDGIFKQKHYMSSNRLYSEWAKMKYRSYNTNWYNAHRYAEKGITLCSEWLEFEPFMRWALENGYRDDLTLDRIDNSKGYAPDNCRWADRKIQVRNRDITLFYEYNGVTKPLAEWSEILGINYRTLYQRIKIKGMSVEEAFTKPVRNKSRFFEYINKSEKDYNGQGQEK